MQLDTILLFLTSFTIVSIRHDVNVNSIWVFLRFVVGEHGRRVM